MGLAVYALAGNWDPFRHRVLMELDGLLSLELSGEHLVGLDILVEYLVPGGISAPCAVEAVLGLDADQVGRDIHAVVRGHKFLNLRGISSCILELAD